MPVLKIPVLKNAGSGKGQFWKMALLENSSILLENAGTENAGTEKLRYSVLPTKNYFPFSC